jgi:hypothetical protein
MKIVARISLDRAYPGSAKANIANLRGSIEVDCHGNAIDTQIGWKITVIILT